jgi:hypothetical protein
MTSGITVFDLFLFACNVSLMFAAHSAAFEHVVDGRSEEGGTCSKA